MLEHSGFEIALIGPDFEYRDHKFLRHWLANRSNVVARLARALLGVLPDPLLVSSGSIRVVARRRHARDLRGVRDARESRDLAPRLSAVLAHVDVAVVGADPQLALFER